MLRIVIADDVPELRTLIKLTLRPQDGFEIVAETGTGAGAIDLVRTMSPDGLILDLGMPQMDGLEILPEVKKACPETKVVVYTAFQHLGEEAVRLGADAHVDKTRDIRELGELLRRLCAEDPAAT